MAGASRNRMPCGHEEDFVHELDEDFCCSICQLPMRKPVQTHCGHRYCAECLKEHHRRQDIADHPRTCPVDRENLPADEGIFFDKATERKILSFIIKCPFTKDGCQWRGELRNKKRVVQCVHCQELHPKGQLKRHVDEKCKKVQLPCPLKCGTLVSREKISNHSVNDCPQTIVACPFAEMGCNTKILRKQTDVHLTSFMRLHLDLTCARLQSSQDEQDKLKETTRKLQAQLVDVNTKYNTLQAKVASEQRKSDEKADQHLKEIERKLQGKIDMLQAQLVDVNVKYKTLQGKEISKQRKLEVTHAMFEGKIHTLQDQVKENERKLEERITLNFLEARLRSQVQKENATESPQFIWKIESFKELFLDRKKKKNLKIESHPFYAAPYSYKLKVYMFPDGQGLGERCYLSVYLTLVRGEYDAVLAWPFHKKVIITLIDQQENQDRRQNVVKCLFADPKLNNFSKPVAEENSGRGFCRFLAHSELDMERFVRDGNMYIQVQICPPS